MKVWLEIVIGISAGDHDVSLVKKHEQVTYRKIERHRKNSYTNRQRVDR